MTSIEQTPFGPLEAQGRLAKSTLKDITHKPNRFGFRGEIALSTDPETALTSVFAVAEEGKSALSLLAGDLTSFRDIKLLVDTLGTALDGHGHYLVYCRDMTPGWRYTVDFGDVSVFVVPIDDNSIYNELIDVYNLDKAKMKKLDTAAKLDEIADYAFKAARHQGDLRRDRRQAELAPIRRNTKAPRHCNSQVALATFVSWW